MLHRCVNVMKLSLYCRKGETPTFGSEKKPCLSTDKSCVGKTGKFPITPLTGDSTLRRRSTPSATITSQEQTSSFSSDDELDSIMNAEITSQGLPNSITGDRQETYLGRRVSMDSATFRDKGKGTSSSTTNNSTEGQGFSTATNQSLNSNNVAIAGPVPSTSAYGQGQTTNTQVQPLLQVCYAT